MIFLIFFLKELKRAPNETQKYCSNKNSFKYSKGFYKVLIIVGLSGEIGRLVSWEIYIFENFRDNFKLFLLS